ncbi:MAG: short-chain dehydrogenase [Candidatus Marinimicrobia bacterium]|jgi:NAD(P)-dependent dehydrogenase (short-subunit alcohol dehydrogenase family)|nr:short-chain dehydrogenase [Candidatus Neomarinimicrobiota bacterium]MBT3631448.1 short-chain dehydrogenase [Candidatus Neomarinimicrobiota bacterium]MBT3825447.1 short-chain dehydrogenase [Candidatus Neomarinimicrobiota bacterium]MBT4131548.1 short-chain dehydrogenase [Candidatus Neomarinimicrobiota bacterium]MBT4294875.1 short-chain dehydrogenase [Candidatus Neomarinimicrobiota bacterium]
MDIKGKRVLIFGGWGLVGQAIAKQLLEEKPSELIVTSLRENEAEEIQTILENHPLNQGTKIISVHGDLFVRDELSYLSKADIYSKPEQVELMIHDIYDDLGPDIINNSKLYQIMDAHKPQILIDCINTATAFAYQNVYQIVAELRAQINDIRKGRSGDDKLIETVERMISTLYIPQLIRHVQILIESMRKADTKLYLKVGTSGTGGMGFNIPYTHSEDKPSKMLMSKSSLAGAHTMLLWLLGRTPHAPIVKEIKPTAAIAWKKIGYGKVIKRGSHIPLFDSVPSEATVLGNTLSKSPESTWDRLGDECLESVYIDAGENGYFSAGEFSVLTGEGQMEFVTPEEIADLTLLEIRGGNTGNDIISSLDSSVLTPSYRAGLIRKDALEKMEALEEKTGKDSVAFELLGPPRLTKLLYEVYILKQLKGNISAVLEADAEELAAQMETEILSNKELRSTILSVGTPILLKDGHTFLRGPDISVPNFEGRTVLDITPENVEKWTSGGWLDLRKSNILIWQERLESLGDDMEKETKQDFSSYYFRNRRFLGATQRMDIGIIVNWVLEYEDKGYRIK